MKPRSWMFIVGILAWLPMLAIMTWTGAEQLAKRPGIDPETALFKRDMIPTRLGTAPQFQAIDWQEDGTTGWYREDSHAAANWKASTSWTNGGADTDSPQLSQIVLRYDSALSAWYNLHRFRVASSYASAWLNDLMQNTQPVAVDVGYRSPNADEQRIVCAVGGAKSCQVWYAWQRYGEYIVLTRLLSLDQPLPAAAFVSVASAADTSVATTFAAVVDDYPPRHPYPLTHFFTVLYICWGLAAWYSIENESAGKQIFGRWWHGHFTRGLQRAYLSNRAMAIAFISMGLVGACSIFSNTTTFPLWFGWTMLIVFTCLSLVAWAASMICMARAIGLDHKPPLTPIQLDSPSTT